jgi:hypothetical protein
MSSTDSISYRLSYLKSKTEGDAGFPCKIDLSGEAAVVSIISTSAAVFSLTSSSTSY